MTAFHAFRSWRRARPCEWIPQGWDANKPYLGYVELAEDYDSSSGTFSRRYPDRSR